MLSEYSPITVPPSTVSTLVNEVLLVVPVFSAVVLPDVKLLSAVEVFPVVFPVSFSCMAASTLSFILLLVVCATTFEAITLCIGCGITNVSKSAYVLNENKSTPYNTPNLFLFNFFI